MWRSALVNSDNKNVLFLCTGNTARSILAEGILRALGGDRFNAYSAGSQPKGVVNPYAIRSLTKAGFGTDGLRSKSWDEFTLHSAPAMNIVVTVCDNAAGETCPFWPGAPISAHWGIPDPATVEGLDAEKEAAFQLAFDQMKTRMEAFLAIPIETLAQDELKVALANIGTLPGATRR